MLYYYVPQNWIYSKCQILIKWCLEHGVYFYNSCYEAVPSEMMFEKPGGLQKCVWYILLHICIWYTDDTDPIYITWYTTSIWIWYVWYTHVHITYVTQIMATLSKQKSNQNTIFNSDSGWFLSPTSLVFSELTVRNVYCIYSGTDELLQNECVNE